MVMGARISLDFKRLAGLGHDFHAGDRAVFTDQIADGGLFTHLGALLAGIIEKHLIELAAQHLPGRSGFVFQMLEEVKRQRGAPMRAYKLDTVFPGECRRFHALENSKALERKVTVGKQRLADVIARKLLLLEQHHAAAFHGEHGRRRRAGGTAPNHDGVVAIIVFHDPSPIVKFH